MSIYQKGDRGPGVTRLEIALKELDLYLGGLDDIYGPGMERAVRSYQERRGLPPTGVADDRTGSMILGEPSPIAESMKGRSTDYRTLALTAGFETSAVAPDCFSGLAGDFDGQGISFGVLQWNLGQGTLQRLLASVEAAHPNALASAFGDEYPQLRSILQQPKDAQLHWARSIQAPNRRTLLEPWRSRFRALGAMAECQEAQVQDARARFERARQMCDDYELWSERGLALMFDIVVQNGSIRADTRLQILSEYRQIDRNASPEVREVERMRIIANRRAEAARPQYVEDVRRRKLAIAEGVGIVHGRGYDVERQYLIGLTKMVEPEPMPLPTPG